MVDSDSNNIPDGWAISNATSLDVTSNVAKFTASAQNGYERIRPTLIAGHQYYVCAFVKADSASVQIAFNSYVSHSGSGDREFHGVIGTCTATSNIFAIKDTSSSGWTPIEIDNAFMIDLTADFADQGEAIPSVDDLNAWFESWIDENGYAESLPWGTIEEVLVYGVAWDVEYTKPSASNTGTSGTLTPYVGTYYASDNEVIEDLDIDGYIVGRC